METKLFFNSLKPDPATVITWFSGKTEASHDYYFLCFLACEILLKKLHMLMT